MYNFLKAVISLLIRIIFRIKIIGENFVPEGKAFIIAANHQSVLDPLLVAATMKNKPINFLAKKELFENSILKFILKRTYVIPIDRDKADFRAMKNAIKVLKTGGILGIFPEGTRKKGPQNPKTKDGIGLFSLKGAAEIKPVSIIPYNNYRLFSRIDIVYHDIYKIPEEYAGDKKENYALISDEVMAIIRGFENKE